MHMEKLIKHLPHAQKFQFQDEIAYEEGQVVSMTLAQNNGAGMTLFAFAEGEGISTHAASGDAMVQILEGKARITIGGETHEVMQGDVIIMPAGVPHALEATTAFKMLLTVIRPE